MRVRKPWTNEHRTTRKAGSGLRKVTSARGDGQLLRMVPNARTASSLAVGSTLVYCYRILLTANPRRLHLQLTHEHRALQADWHQVVFSCESRFNLGDHDDRIRVIRYVVERCLPECVIERHSGLIPGVMQDNAHPHAAKTVRDFCLAQHMQLLPWTAYSPHMLPF
ncbi:hypothetical protein TNCV_631831 [Trichonephila clavipes]|nr:hypothetical protein TNCV_631831 [Trichonephila clavipes]